jgi:hypothetical protein
VKLVVFKIDYLPPSSHLNLTAGREGERGSDGRQLATKEKGEHGVASHKRRQKMSSGVREKYVSRDCWAMCMVWI